MKILIIGCGYIGAVLAQQVSERLPTAEIVISDVNLSAVEPVAAALHKDNVVPLQLDFYKYDMLVKTAREFDLVVGLAPGRLGYHTVQAVIEAGVDMVDLSYMAEDPFTLENAALKADVTVIPDCGVAPGLSNILIGNAVSQLDQVTSVRILVGGLPQTRIPPLDYKVTWCVEDLIEEYVRKAKIVRAGTMVEVEALDGLEELEFPGIGRLEAFYTDGVRTLHHTVHGVDTMEEKTLRYPGHAQKIKLLRGLGLFDDTLVAGASPRFLMTKLFERILSRPEVKDLVALEVTVDGLRLDQRTRYLYRLTDHYHEATGVTAMGRTTAYTATAVIQLLATQRIREKGVVPPEKVGMDAGLFRKIVSILAEEEIHITMHTS